jgi:hypothetical protein
LVVPLQAQRSQPMHILDGCFLALRLHFQRIFDFFSSRRFALENSLCKGAAVSVNHKALTAMTRVFESPVLKYTKGTRTTESSRGRRQLRRRVVSRRILTSAQRMELSRWRRKRGIHRRTVSVTDHQLDALEVRGYLNPDRRGDRADECDAIEIFLGDSLAKSR